MRLLPLQRRIAKTCNLKGGNIMYKHLIIFVLLIAVPLVVDAKECPSKTTLKIQSSNYSGIINIELRRGTRPGSKTIERRSINTNGTINFQNVCPGTYFFAFGTPDSNSVSVTRYFQINNNGRTYNNPTISVFYSRSSSSDSQRIGNARKSDL